MGTGTRNIRQKRRFITGSFNVRGLTKDTTNEQLVKDVQQYSVNVCALQETKIVNAGVHRVNGSMIITFDSKNKHYGNAFVVPKKWKESIHKYWRESDRICVPGILIPVLMDHSTSANQQETAELRSVKLR